MSLRVCFSSFIFILITSQDLTSQVIFEDISWDDALEMSMKESKPIFVDVYTKWCGPCRKMDATTFQDTAVGNYMNRHFINLKWDAGDYKYKKLVNQYFVKGYPTLLYIDDGGHVMKRRNGMHDSQRLLNLSDHVLEFANADYSGLVKNIKSNHRQNKTEIIKALNVFKDFYVPEKEEIYSLLFNIYRQESTIPADEYHLVVENLYNINHLAYAVKHYPENGDDKNPVRLRSLIKSKINRNFQEALKTNDKELIHRTAEINIDFGKKINKNNRMQNAINENNDKLLEFYSKHKHKDEYAPLAEKMIQLAIIPYTPNMMLQKDEHLQAIKSKTIGKNEKNKSLSRRSLYEEKKSSFKMAYKLQKVVQNYVEFYDDTPLLEKALSWAELSTSYIDLPENRLSRAKVLEKLGFSEEAHMHLRKGLASVYLTDKIKTEILEYQSHLSGK